MLKLTREQINAGKSEKGGWTRETLAGWGIGWPPPRGWKDALLDGKEIANTASVEVETNPNGLEAKLLHQVVMAVISAGQSDILKGIDDLNAYYDSALPTVADIVGSRPETAIIEGGIMWDDKVYRFSVAQTIRKPETTAS